MEKVVTLFNINEPFPDLQLVGLTKLIDENVGQMKEPSAIWFSKMKTATKLFIWEVGQDQLDLILKCRAEDSLMAYLDVKKRRGSRVEERRVIQLSYLEVF